MKARKIIFLATEDWFIASHFRPLLQRARADGFEVVVAARDSGVLRSEDGVRIVPMPFSRRALAPDQLLREAHALRKLIDAERPDLVHAIALKPIALCILAGLRAPTRFVIAFTGRGYLEARGGWRRMVLSAIARRVRAAVIRGDALLLTENKADQEWIEAGVSLPSNGKMLMPGAGVDPLAFQPAPEPATAPIVIGIAARLVRSKGIDLAVAAVRRLREQGLTIELHVAGEVDPDNPEHVGAVELESWRGRPEVRLLGRVADINAFWRSTHVACLPSRGGEGLPRTLLEAAACGRAIVTTDAPGCGDFIAATGGGLVTPREDVRQLAAALQQLAGDTALRHRLGAAGRASVIASYTETDAAACAAKAWAGLLAQ